MRAVKFLREPLFHFFVLGAAIFAIYGIVTKRHLKPDEIVITQGKMENIRTTFVRTWQRPPTDTEWNGLIRDYIREEVAYREAKAMGLDQDDTIIRRRLRQKLEFVSEDLVSLREPTEADLADYLSSHSEAFQTEPTFTFLQVYFSPKNSKQNVGEVLSTLRQQGEDADLSTMGDPFVLENHFENLTASDVQKMFGEKFYASLVAAKIGQWEEPIESGYGEHLVFISRRSEGSVPALAEIRDRVRREWTNAKRIETNEAFYRGLLQRYKITIEPPQEKKMAQGR